MDRTPAQYAADRRRSHKAKAKREQNNARWSHLLVVGSRANGRDSHATVAVMANITALYAANARRHLNFLMSGTYADFA